MKIKNLTIIAILVFLSACKNTSSEKTEIIEKTETTQITQEESKQVIDKWLKLWETYDLNMLDDIFLQSDELTYFSSEKEGLMKGFKHLKPHHISFGFVEGGKAPEKALWLEKVETRIYEGSTMVGGVWYFGDKSLPKDSISKGPVTFVLIKNKEGDTKIAHTHFANY